MGILDRIKLRKKKTAAPVVESERRKEVVETPMDTGQAYKILVRPILSEKGTMLAGSGKYVFAVSRQANKSEIKKSIEKVYGVNVEAVNVVNVPGKQRRYGRTIGRTSSWKKAVITVKKGQKIPGIIESVG